MHATPIHANTKRTGAEIDALEWELDETPCAPTQAEGQLYAGSADFGGEPGVPRSSLLTRAQRRALLPLLKLIDHPGLRDLVMHDTGSGVQAWCDIGEGLKRLPDLPLSAEEFRGFAVGVIAAGGRQLDDLHPAVDVSVGDGVRVHAILAPVAVTGTALSFRVPSATPLSLLDMCKNGLCDADAEQELMNMVRKRQNVLITGGTGTGKTTLLSALLMFAPHTDRIITIEDTAELRPRHPHRVGLESRAANSEGAGAVSLDELLRAALRMRPDRVILGECRGAEVATMLTALNTGHDGGASTLHARSLHDVPARLEALGALAGLDRFALAAQAVTAIDRVVHLTRTGATFRLEHIGEFGRDAHGLLTVSALTGEAR